VYIKIKVIATPFFTVAGKALNAKFQMKINEQQPNLNG